MGKIILLNTPIGNLGDLTPRVLEGLKVGETFAVEDTRVFKELLNHLGISVSGKRIHSLHDQSGEGEVRRLLEIARTQDLYVASEAGSPIVSDPAFPLVVGAYEAGFKVESYSGVSSPIMALELAGLPPIPFHFHGFLPREKGKIEKTFASLSYGTHLFFEAPTRVEETLRILAQVAPDLSVAFVRELSKKFEEVRRFKAQEWDTIRGDVTFKGEFVLVIHEARSREGALSSEVKDLAEEILKTGAQPKKLAKLLGHILDRPTKDLYEELSRQKKNS